MIMPSIALPTGPYDWKESSTRLSTYKERLRNLRALMEEEGVTHAIVYGNTFDHADLLWFANFIPKLGLALMLIPLVGEPRLLFSGGPGMKPSAARLTWIEDVAALRSIPRDVGAWLEGQGNAKICIVAGASVSHGDWRDIEAAAGGSLVDLEPRALAQRSGSRDEVEAVRASARLLQATADRLFADWRGGSDIRHLALEAERHAYRAQGQDVRMRVARKPWGRPLTLPDTSLRVDGPLPLVLAVRRDGYWASAAFVLGDISGISSSVGAALELSQTCTGYVNRVAFPEAGAVGGGLAIFSTEAHGAIWSALCLLNDASREKLFWPPGL